MHQEDPRCTGVCKGNSRDTRLFRNVAYVWVPRGVEVRALPAPGVPPLRRCQGGVRLI